MNRGDAARLLLAVALQRPLLEGGSNTLSPPPVSTVGSVQEDTEKDTSTRSTAARSRALQACADADLSNSKKQQIDALILLWNYVFPDTVWTLSPHAATELLKIAGGSAQKVFLYLEELKDDNSIQWPLAFSRSHLQRMMRQEREGKSRMETRLDIDSRMMEALRLAATKGDNDGYIDFRHYIEEANGGTTGS